MYTQIVILVVCLASSFADIQPVELIENEDGQLYYLVPANGVHQERVRRQTDWSLGRSGGYLGHTGTIWSNNNNRVEGSAYAERELFPKGPLTTGNSISWKNSRTDSGVTLSNENTRGRGNDAKLEGTYNFFQTPDKKAVFGVTGEVAQHYGHGPSSRPEGAIFLHGKVDLD